MVHCPPSGTTIIIRVPALLLWLVAVLLLTGCAAAVEADSSGTGGSSPEAVTESFFEDLNAALQDPALDDLEKRRLWAARLAGHFAPSERITQRTFMARTLADLSYNLSQRSDERLLIEIIYSRIEMVERRSDEARVRLVDGKIRLTWYRDERDGSRLVLREQERSLTEVIGLSSGVFPTVRVNRQWFLTGS